MHYSIAEESTIQLSSGTKLIHYHYDIIPSTQIVAKKQINQLNPSHWYLYTANGQSSGVGQNNSTWESPYNLNIYATYVFFLEQKFNDIILQIPQITALSVMQVLENYNIKSSLKWVNDVLINQKKLSGILVECISVNTESLIPVFTGIGINVNSESNHLSNILQPVTSMKIETALNYDLSQIINKLSDIFVSNIRSLILNSFEIFKELIEKNLEKFDNVPIIFDTRTESMNRYNVGIIKGIGDKGELLLTTNKGEVKSFFNGRILRSKEIKQALLDKGLLGIIRID